MSDDADEKEVLEKEQMESKREKNARLNEIKDLQDILALDAGKRVMRRILEEAKVFQSCMTGNSWTFHNEGKRDLGLWLTDEIVEANEQAYLKILTINKGKKNG